MLFLLRPHQLISSLSPLYRLTLCPQMRTRACPHQTTQTPLLPSHWPRPPTWKVSRATTRVTRNSPRCPKCMPPSCHVTRDSPKTFRNCALTVRRAAYSLTTAITYRSVLTPHSAARTLMEAWGSTRDEEGTLRDHALGISNSGNTLSAWLVGL